MKYLIIGAILLLTVGGDTEREYTDHIEGLRKVKQHLAKEYNQDYCILVDFSKHSGVNRMHIYDLKKDRIYKSYLVAHGEGSGTVNGKPIKFSNIIGSNMSSLGVSVLGRRDFSSYGIGVKYWMKGLESTNSNMEKRVVVIHSWEGIPNIQNPIIPIVNSQGCLTVSNKALEEIDKFIQGQRNKKILISTYTK